MGVGEWGGMEGSDVSRNTTTRHLTRTLEYSRKSTPRLSASRMTASCEKRAKSASMAEKSSAPSSPLPPAAAAVRFRSSKSNVKSPSSMTPSSSAEPSPMAVAAGAGAEVAAAAAVIARALPPASNDARAGSSASALAPELGCCTVDALPPPANPNSASDAAAAGTGPLGFRGAPNKELRAASSAADDDVSAIVQTQRGEREISGLWGKGFNSFFFGQAAAAIPLT